MKRIFLASIVVALCALPAFALSSVIRDSTITDAPGFRFDTLRFELDYMTFYIANSTKENLTFSGTMTFLNMRGRVVAEAELLPKRFVAGQRHFYKQRFTMGSSGEAKRAQKIIWRTQTTR